MRSMARSSRRNGKAQEKVMEEGRRVRRRMAEIIFEPGEAPEEVLGESSFASY